MTTTSEAIASLADSLRTLAGQVAEYEKRCAACERRLEELGLKTGEVASSVTRIAGISTSKPAMILYGGLAAIVLWAITSAMGMPWSALLPAVGVAP